MGEQSYAELESAAEWMAGIIPRGEWKTIPGARHQWEPEAMARELGQFLEQLPRPA